MSDDTPGRKDQRIEITPHIRVLYGAVVDDWIGWAVWDDYAEECPVYRTSAEAVSAAKQLAAEYANGER
jgi:hypothetical protein